MRPLDQVSYELTYSNRCGKPMLPQGRDSKQSGRSRGCIQDNCACIPIDCPSSEAKPIDRVEAAKGQANLPNDPRYAL